MTKRLFPLICVSLVLGLGGVAGAGVFTDNFDTPRNYLTDGTASTGWDGFLGLGPGETVTTLDASTSRSGQLYMQSTRSYWQDPWSPAVGPLLYKLVEGDFVASVKVTEYAGTEAAYVYYNNCGLMARLPGPAGVNENWVAIDYFPLYSCGNYIRSATNNVRTENRNNGKGFGLDPWLQLERKGNTFYFRTSQDGVTWTDMPLASLTRNDFANLPVQVGMAHAVYTSGVGYAAFDDFSLSGPNVVALEQALNPSPADKATELLLQKITLTWKPNEKAVKHDVYFGTSLADVTNASRANLTGVQSSIAQDANSFDPGPVARGVTYYWRVDEVKADATLVPGWIWRFTMEPASYPIQGVTATASSSATNRGPERTVNGSGLTGDMHSDLAGDMWFSLNKATGPTWIQFAFDKAYKLDKVQVWNSNQSMEPEWGLGVKDALVECSLDGSTWTPLGQVEIPQAPGDPNYTGVSLDLGGTLAQYIKVNIQSNWGGLLKQYSLSEVRFYYIPVWAHAPQPATAATAVNPQVALQWHAGYETASHQLYVGTDPNAVQDGTAPVVTTSEPSYDLAANLATTYYWKVVEVNNAMMPNAWAGDVWSFTTTSNIVVDDFESYTDKEGEAVYQIWIDGYDYPETNGAWVGLQEPANGTFCSTTVIHGGRQAMPLTYDNTGAITSEATRTFTDAQDWSQYGITTLVVWFRGDVNNVPAPLYVKINNTKIQFNNGTPSTAFPLWKQWNIDLTGLGATIKSVKTLTIGVGDGKSSGTGTIYVDDLILYATAPQITVTPADPGTNGLVALYAMEGNVQDTSGKGNHGTLSGNPAYGSSMAGYGQALKFDGLDDYVTLPIGSMLSTMSSITVATWVSWPTGGGAWQRVWDFGTGDTNYMFLTPNRAGGQSPRFAIKTAAAAEWYISSSAGVLSAGWHHLAVTIDGATKVATLYVDGVAARTGTSTALPKDLGVTTQNWIGRSQYTTDSFLTGAVDDFRIYNVALTANQIRYLAGDR